jgi:hypothetical protein
MAELTDETDMARGFSLIPVTWAVVGTLGSDMFGLPFVPLLILCSGPIGPSLMVCSRDHKIVDQISSHILFGANTHTFCPVSPPLYLFSSHLLSAIFPKEASCSL